MHPAFSVIFFTTLSGTGYGLCIWTMLYGYRMITGADMGSAGVALATTYVSLALAAVLIAVGLGSSVLHLGKPMRAWRALSQWRTSWLSREGVLAISTFVPLAYFLAYPLTRLGDPIASEGVIYAAAAWLVAGAFATVLCTAMIYASLRPIPAWSHRLVPWVYVVFALHTGSLVLLAFIALSMGVIDPDASALLVVILSMLAWRLKRRYWRDIDRGQMPATRASALGLPADRVATVFERPHTEANYLTREMGYVLARKHSARLRVIAVVLFAFVPMVCVAPMFVLPGLPAGSLLAVAAVSALLGTLVERWLFFAEAKHVVMLYY